MLLLRRARPAAVSEPAEQDELRRVGERAGGEGHESPPSLVGVWGVGRAG